MIQSDRVNYRARTVAERGDATCIDAGRNTPNPLDSPDSPRHRDGIDESRRTKTKRRIDNVRLGPRGTVLLGSTALAVTLTLYWPSALLYQTEAPVVIGATSLFSWLAYGRGIRFTGITRLVIIYIFWVAFVSVAKGSFDFFEIALMPAIAVPLVSAVDRGIRFPNELIVLSASLGLAVATLTPSLLGGIDYSGTGINQLLLGHLMWIAPMAAAQLPISLVNRSLLIGVLLVFDLYLLRVLLVSGPLLAGAVALAVYAIRIRGLWRPLIVMVLGITASVLMWFVLSSSLAEVASGSGRANSFVRLTIWKQVVSNVSLIGNGTAPIETPGAQLIYNEFAHAHNFIVDSLHLGGPAALVLVVLIIKRSISNLSAAQPIAVGLVAAHLVSFGSFVSPALWVALAFLAQSATAPPRRHGERARSGPQPLRSTSRLDGSSSLDLRAGVWQ